MSLHDLQGLKVEGKRTAAAPPGSRASKGCGNNGGGTTVQSNVSLILCTLSL
jgi:hypothetical protein